MDFSYTYTDDCQMESCFGSSNDADATMFYRLLFFKFSDKNAFIIRTLQLPVHRFRKTTVIFSRRFSIYIEIYK